MTKTHLTTNVLLFGITLQKMKQIINKCLILGVQALCDISKAYTCEVFGFLSKKRKKSINS